MGDHRYKINESFVSDSQEQLIPDDEVKDSPPSQWKFWNILKKNSSKPSEVNEHASSQKRSVPTKIVANQSENQAVLRSSTLLTYEKLKSEQISNIHSDEIKNMMMVNKFKQYLKGLQPVEIKNNEPLANGVLIEGKNIIVASTIKNGLRIIKLAKNEDGLSLNPIPEATDHQEESFTSRMESNYHAEKKISFERIKGSIWKQIEPIFTLKNRFELIILYLSTGQKCQEIMNCQPIQELYAEIEKFIKTQAEFPDLLIDHLAEIDEVVSKDNEIEFCLLFDPNNPKVKTKTAPKNTIKVLAFKVSEKSNSFTISLKVFEKTLKFTPSKLKYSSKGKHILVLGKSSNAPKAYNESIIKLIEVGSDSSCWHCNKFAVDPYATSFILIDETSTLIVSSKSGCLYFHDIRVKERKFVVEAHSFSVSKILYWENNIISLSLDKKAILTSIPKELQKLKVFKSFAYSMCLNSKKEFLYIRTANMKKLDEEEKDSYLKMHKIDKIKRLNLENFEKIKLKTLKSKSEFFTIASNQKQISGIEAKKEEKTRLKSLLYIPSSLGKDTLIFDSFTSVYKIEIDESGSSKFQFEEKIKYHFYHSIVNIGNFIICAGFEMNYELFDISNEINKVEGYSLKNKHSDIITLLIKHSVPNPSPGQKSVRDYLISGSRNGTIVAYIIKSPFNFEDEPKFQILKGHSLQITALTVLNNKIWSASKDNTMKVWNSIENLIADNQENIKLVYTIEGINGIVYFMAPYCNKYILTCTLFGKLQCYSSVTYTPIFSTIIFGPIRSFLTYNKKIVYSNAENIFEQQLDIEEEDFGSNDDSCQREDFEISLLGPQESQMYQAAHYFSRILNEQTFEFQPEYDKWVILPFLLTPLHFYARNNLPKFIKQSFINSNSLIESTNKQSALSIAVSKDNEDCVMVIIKYLKYKAESNPYLIDFLSNSDLITMNFNGRSSLSLFYQILLTKVTAGNPPRFASYQSELPIYNTDEDVVINYKEKFPEIYSPNININKEPDDSYNSNNAIATGKSIVFMRSLIKITHEMGSASSLRVVKSFVECKNLEIFNTPFVQAYIEHKFSTTLTYMRIEFIIYLLYMFLLCSTLILDSYTNIFMSLVLTSGFLVTLIEIIRAISYGLSYFFEFRNIVNAIRAILFYFFIGYTWNCLENNKSLHDTDGINFPLFLLAMLSFMKGLTFFQLFEHTRYFLALLKRIFFDSISFLSFLTYFILATSLILLMVSGYSREISETFENGYMIVTGGLDPVGSDFSVPEWLVFIAAVVLMTWIMMNLLVAIFNNSFNIVYNTNDMYNYSIMIWMAYEVEMVINFLYKVLSWFTITTKEVPETRKYLYVCQNGNWKDESDAISKRIHKTKVLIKDSIKKINEVCDESLKVKRLSKKIFKASNEKNRKNKNKDEEMMNFFNFLVHCTHINGLRDLRNDSQKLLELLKNLE